MKPKLLILLSFLPFVVSAQTKQIVTEDRDHNRIEKYYVLEKNHDIKEGEYKVYGFFQGYLRVDGFYKNNLKDSLWRMYAYGNKLLLEGKYKADKKTGTWTAYDSQNQIQVQYDYTNKSLLTFKSSATDTSMLYRVINGRDTTLSQPDRRPVYLDGEATFKNIIGQEMKYPAAAREALKRGTVIISFTVGVDGKVSNYRVIKALGYGLDESALAAVMAANGEWLPAMRSGKPVASEYDVPATFSLAY